MKFKYIDPDALGGIEPLSDQDGEATVANLDTVLGLLSQILNELRCIRSLHYSLPDPDDLKAQEDKG